MNEEINLTQFSSVKNIENVMDHNLTNTCKNVCSTVEVVYRTVIA